MPRPSTAPGPFSVFWFVRAAAHPADARRRLDPHLRRQFQRLRPDLRDQGRARRTEFLHRHPRHVLLPHLLRLPAPGRQPDHGRGGGDRYADHHPGRRPVYLFGVQRRLQRHTLLGDGHGNERSARPHRRPYRADPLHDPGARPDPPHPHQRLQDAAGDLRRSAWRFPTAETFTPIGFDSVLAKCGFRALFLQQPRRSRSVSLVADRAASAPWPPGR